MNDPSTLNRAQVAALGLTVAAGLRGAHWQGGGQRADITSRVFVLRTSDGGICNGILFFKGAPTGVVFLMHPREFIASHYLVPVCVDAGFAVWLQAPRTIGNDMRLEHEICLLDVAAGVRELKKQGFRYLVAIGNSGGASLLSFYQSQAVTAPGRRIGHTPGGRSTKLSQEAMPVFDGFIYVSPHLGQGIMLMNAIDPSVTDERDAFSTDPSLDPFSRANGFRHPPETSSYRPDFVARYRVAQRARVERLDAMARQMIAPRRAARSALKDGLSADVLRMSAYQPVLAIWRTDADLRCWDSSLDPSDRKVGSLWGSNPLVSNLGSVGFARFCSPEAWLSTWSGVSSNVDMRLIAPQIDVPTLMVVFTGDVVAFPADVQTLFDALPGGDRSLHKLPGNHHGEALEAGAPAGRELIQPIIQTWLRERFADTTK
jgi:pimeloyl-ACP methyl ester carboxylesterase